MVLLAFALVSPAWAESSRFFFGGDGHLRLADAHSDRRLDARFRRPDGSYDEQALAQLRSFFRSRGDRREGEMSLRLFELIDWAEELLHPRKLVLLSGYRSPEFNEDLRAGGVLAAQASLHTQGLAADLMFSGVKLRPAWNRLRERRIGGVGLYEKQGFLHLDTGQPRFWEPATSKVTENISQGNARLFARTDFDRYSSLVGAVIRLHSVTALPLRIEPLASLAESGTQLTLEAGRGVVGEPGGCLLLSSAGEVFELRVTDQAPVHAPQLRARDRIRLTTCAPRIEKTPESFESNELELSAAAAH